MSLSSEITITTSDNTVLGATLFEAPAPKDRVVVINAAMGVKRTFYSKYAAYLAEQGLSTIIYDYRGIGDSRAAGISLRATAASLWQWGALDQAAVIAWIINRYPDASVWIVGHSVGGQIVGLTPYRNQIAGLLGIAAQSGYWRGWRGMQALLMLALWRVIVPAVTGARGYLPGRFFGAGEDVPKGVAIEWAQAGRKPRYIRDQFAKTTHDHFDAFRGMIRAYSFSDDRFAPRQTVANLLPLYPHAHSEQIHLSPAQAKLPKIGHFGFFRSAAKDTLWRDSAAWLMQTPHGDKLSRLELGGRAHGHFVRNTI